MITDVEIVPPPTSSKSRFHDCQRTAMYLLVVSSSSTQIWIQYCNCFVDTILSSFLFFVLTRQAGAPASGRIVLLTPTKNHVRSLCGTSQKSIGDIIF